MAVCWTIDLDWKLFPDSEFFLIDKVEVKYDNKRYFIDRDRLMEVLQELGIARLEGEQ